MKNKYSILLKEAKYLYSGILQNYLVFIPAKNTLNISVTLLRLICGNLMECQKKIMKNVTKLDSHFAPAFVDHHLLPDINFNGQCFINNNICIPKKVINLYISYMLNPWLRNWNTDFKLKNCLFGSVKLIQINTNIVAAAYDLIPVQNFSFTDGSMGRNIIIFGADMSSPVHIDNKNKDILISGEEPTQGLDDTTLTAEAKYAINFTQPKIRFAISLHCDRKNSFLFVNATKTYHFKAKDSEIKDYTLCLGNISKDFTIQAFTTQACSFS